MHRFFVPVAVSALLLGACSPAQYKVNPPSPEKVQEAVPESQQAGYMRILGDLRWDRLTSNPEWRERFGCLMNSETSLAMERSYPQGSPHNNGYRTSYSYNINGRSQGSFVDWVRERRGPGDSLSNSGYILSDSPYGKWAKPVTAECDYEVGGVPLGLKSVSFGSNSGTKSKFMTTSVIFGFSDDSQSRAFKSALADKYDLTSDGYCSRYTCWGLGDIDTAGVIKASPTPYAVSILDQVKINTSEL